MIRFEPILRVFHDDPRDLTYLGIGSGPSTTEPLTAETDQIMPSFLRQELGKAPVRAIHFDPALHENQGRERMAFLSAYFEKSFPGLTHSVPTRDQPFHKWSSPQLEVIVVPEALYYQGDAQVFSPHPRRDQDDEEFLTRISHAVIHSGGRLVVQDFSGRSQVGPLKRVFQAMSPDEQIAFKERVLFDMTYGDGHCSPDMKSMKPLTDAHGHFINFALFNSEEKRAAIATHPELRPIAHAQLVAQFKSVLNEHYPQYRQTMLSDVEGIDPATRHAHAAAIMTVLREGLSRQIEVLRQIPQAISEARFLEFQELLARLEAQTQQGKSAKQAIYDWYTQANRLLP